MRLHRPDTRTGPAHALLPALTTALTVGWVLALGGCGPEAETVASTVRDSAGVTIVENEAPDSTRMPVWHTASEPSLDIGKLDGSDAETLFRVVGAVRLSDGRVAVANAGTSEIRYYGPDGGHLRTAGGEGGGPGEFQRIARILRMPADSIGIMDLSARRVSVLGPDGGFAREVSTAASDAMLQVFGVRPDGSWVASFDRIISPGGLQEGLMRPEVVWVRVPASGGEPDTVATLQGSERVLQIGRSGGQITSVSIMTPPFGRTTTVLPSGDDLVVATQNAAQVEVYGPDGALRRVVRTGVPLRPVTPELVDAVLERRYADFPEERRRDALQAAREMPAGAFVPAYGTVTLDRTGRIWVQDYAALSDDNLWTVYAADGTAEARIALPAHFTPYDIGERWILGRELDELEVEHVRAYELTKP